VKLTPVAGGVQHIHSVCVSLLRKGFCYQVSHFGCLEDRFGVSGQVCVYVLHMMKPAAA